MVIRIFYGTIQAQENLGTYLGKINTTVNDLPTIPAQETIVILSDPLQNPSGAIPFESNPFNLRIVAKNRLRSLGEIEIDSADTLDSTSSAVLQYWWICDVNTQMNCEACYSSEILPPLRPFPSDAIRRCLVDTHTAVGDLHNLLAISVAPSFPAVQTAIEKGATLTGTIDEDKSLTLTIKGMTVSEQSFESEIEAKLK